MSVEKESPSDKLESKSLVHDSTKITSGNKTTIPKQIRQVLGIEEGDHVKWGYVSEDGTVQVTKDE